MAVNFAKAMTLWPTRSPSTKLPLTQDHEDDFAKDLALQVDEEDEEARLAETRQVDILNIGHAFDKNKKRLIEASPGPHLTPSK